MNYQSACSRGIYSLISADEMLGNAHSAYRPMGIDHQMDDLHTRMMRVTEDLRVIQRELNCAAMQAPSDPELMEALTTLPETEAIQLLCKALDQMRHFLWFYTQVMSNEPELGDKLRQAGIKAEDGNLDASIFDQLTHGDEAVLLRFLADAKDRKPN